jgi:hypothetical protein
MRKRISLWRACSLSSAPQDGRAKAGPSSSRYVFKEKHEKIVFLAMIPFPHRRKRGNGIIHGIMSHRTDALKRVPPHRVMNFKEKTKDRFCSNVLIFLQKKKGKWNHSRHNEEGPALARPSCDVHKRVPTHHVMNFKEKHERSFF